MAIEQEHERTERLALERRNRQGFAVGDVDPTSGRPVVGIVARSQPVRGASYSNDEDPRAIPNAVDRVLAYARQAENRAAELANPARTAAQPAQEPFAVMGAGKTSEASWRERFGPTRDAAMEKATPGNRPTLMTASETQTDRFNRAGSAEEYAAGSAAPPRTLAEYRNRQNVLAGRTSPVSRPVRYQALPDPVSKGTMVVDLRSPRPFANPRVLPGITPPARSLSATENSGWVDAQMRRREEDRNRLSITTAGGGRTVRGRYGSVSGVPSMTGRTFY